MTSDALSVLRCARCRGVLTAAAEALLCAPCALRIPVVDGIPRFVQEPDDDTAKRTQASFGYEWTHFNDWRPSGATNFGDYFAGFDLPSLAGRLVLDAGCGMGRHARQVAPFAGHLIALDFSRAIEQAARNTSTLDNVHCIQADLLALPVAPASIDFIYSLGVLHHLEQTEQALQGLVQALRPGGRLRIYLYWKHHGWRGALLSLATAARAVTTRMPFGLLRVCCWLLSVALFLTVVLGYRLLDALGVRAHQSWPLYSYAKYPFTVLYNDQFDRFSAPIEKRYDPHEVKSLLERAGLESVVVRSCYGWVADGTRPA